MPYLRQFLMGMVISLLMIFPAKAQTEENPDASSADAYISSEISSTDRYEIIRSPSPHKDIFRFDRACGNIELFSRNDAHDGWYWQTMRIPSLFPCIVDGRNHYQFFAMVQDDHFFLLHTDTKTTWLLNRENMIWVRM
jgi:hypothetical protein